ncbi:MAG TPA: DMT family transporter [Burkholderiales bacterium]|nr:DMT family transporter [Burkholderiales bacterium]
MTAGDAGRLVALAAIWGAAFIFMRVAAPVLGPIWTPELRVLLGGLALLAWLRASGFNPGLSTHWRPYFVVGSIGIAVPFALYAFAAIHAPASLLAIVNATAPIFGLAWGAALGEERVTAKKSLGLALGVAGVALLVRPAGAAPSPLFYWAIAAALGACFLYGVVGVLVKRFAKGVPPRAMAAGNQLAAAVVLAPILPFFPAPGEPSALVVANVLALALLASGVAFVLYFRLIADVGATRALTVTYLIPAFGVLWGWLFLDETISAAMLGGGALIVLGTVLVLRN